MSTPDASGPAFPLQTVFDNRLGELVQAGNPGMTLRQWYAGLAMQQLLQRQLQLSVVEMVDMIPAAAFGLADKMIKESNK